eukprot:TRINITY_DN23340_c0_g1_i1.p2 TRINITY_DN23340_c0_g1~~TRINITY_DN23340_c0_g1_i1.p2  ORF type:complete len:150 (+),score=30.13 TRINITY_DN23340_c0_g1_i1:74-523(+)
MEVIRINDYESNWTAIVEEKGVFRAKHLASGKNHVIKTLKIQSLKEIDNYYTEVLVHSRIVPNPSIVQIYGRCLIVDPPKASTNIQEATLYIALEEMEKTLTDEIRERKTKNLPYALHENYNSKRARDSWLCHLSEIERALCIFLQDNR